MSTESGHLPKALLRFGAKTLLRRHIESMMLFDICELIIVKGYEGDQIESELVALGTNGFARTVFNPFFRESSLLSLWCVRQELLRGDDVILMDADVLYDHRLIARLVKSRAANCFLLDRDFEEGDEPVKLCVRDGELVDFGKTVIESCDYRGESVGFFRFTASVCERLVKVMARHVKATWVTEPYETAIREVLQESAPGTFGWEDVTGLPWIEIDFPADVVRARREILPRLMEPESPKIDLVATAQDVLHDLA